MGSLCADCETIRALHRCPDVLIEIVSTYSIKDGNLFSVVGGQRHMNFLVRIDRLTRVCTFLRQILQRHGRTKSRRHGGKTQHNTRFASRYGHY